MAVRELEFLGSELLRTPGERVETFDAGLRDLAGDMFETMYAADGIGLAAPQVGLSLRLIVLDVPEEEEGESALRGAFANPEVVSTSRELDRMEEGCLSIPGVKGVVERPFSVVVEALDPKGRPVTVRARGLPARALQHEIDHLNGILFIDRLSAFQRAIALRRWRKLRAKTRAP